MNYFLLLFLIPITLIYLLIRNERVHDFRVNLIYTDPKSYFKLPKYGKMLYSFKPLKLKYWIK